MYSAINLTFLLKWGKTWSLTLRVRVFDDKILLSRIFEPKRRKVTGDWGNTQYE
jgi:hypothetical protein